MKKGTIFLLLFIISVSLFAVDFQLSTGILGGYTALIDRGSVPHDSDFSDNFYYESGYDITNIELFFDATYVYFGFGFENFLRGYQRIELYDSSSSTYLYEIDTELDGMRLDFIANCYLKYPLGTERMVVYPMVGIKQAFNLIYTDADGSDLRAALSDDQLEALNRLIIQFGAGADISLSEHLYLRFTAVGGPRLKNDMELDIMAYVPDLEVKSFAPIDIKLGLGFSF